MTGFPDQIAGKGHNASGTEFRIAVMHIFRVCMGPFLFLSCNIYVYIYIVNNLLLVSSNMVPSVANVQF